MTVMFHQNYETATQAGEARDENFSAVQPHQATEVTARCNENDYRAYNMQS